MNHDNQFELENEDNIEEMELEYDYYDDLKYNIHGKQKSMKSTKNGNKPQWRADRKIQKKFKHDILGID